jgi:hypothetical protein
MHERFSAYKRGLTWLKVKGVPLVLAAPAVASATECLARQLSQSDTNKKPPL